MPPPTDIAIALVIVALAAALQGSVGFGFSVVTVPTLTLLDPSFTPVPVLLVAFPISAWAWSRERDDIDSSGFGWVITGRVVGSLLGAAVLGAVTERVLSWVIAVLVLAAVAVLARGVTLRLSTRTRMVAGMVSGFAGTTSAIGGPPIALLYRSQPGGTTRSTLGAVFAIGMFTSLVILGLSGLINATDVEVALRLAPAAIIGFLFSGRIKHLVDGEILRRAILAVAGTAGIVLLITSAVS